MRKLIASTMVSLDGVMQAPGGSEEDPIGGFAFGGWTFAHWDEAMGRSMNGLDGKDRELVPGRRTSEIFEGVLASPAGRQPDCADAQQAAVRSLKPAQGPARCGWSLRKPRSPMS